MEISKDELISYGIKELNELECDEFELSTIKLIDVKRLKLVESDFEYLHLIFETIYDRYPIVVVLKDQDDILTEFNLHSKEGFLSLLAKENFEAKELILEVI